MFPNRNRINHRLALYTSEDPTRKKRMDYYPTIWSEFRRKGEGSLKREGERFLGVNHRRHESTKMISMSQVTSRSNKRVH